MNRTFRWCCLIVFGLAASHSGVGQGTLKDNAIILPVNQFEANKAFGRDGVAIQEFGVGNGFLLFLVCPVPNNEECAAVLTDFDGQLFHRVPLGPGTVIGVAPTPGGFAALIQPPARPIINRSYSWVEGSFADSPVTGDAAYIVQAADSLLHLSREGRIVRPEAKEPQRPISARDRTPADRIPRSLTVMPFSDGRVAILEGVAGSLSVIDPAKGTEKSVPLSHAEIEKAKGSYADLKLPNGIAGVAVVAAAVDRHDHILAALSGFRPEDGLLVLVFDSAGRFLRFVRCGIGRRADGKMVAPAKLGASDSHVFLVDASGTVEVFSLNEIDPPSRKE